MASSHDADTAGITRRKSLSALAGAGALALAGCTQSGNGGDGGDELSGPINIAGSSTVFPLMSAVMEDFAAEHPGVVVVHDKARPAEEIATELERIVATYPDRESFRGFESADDWTT